MAVQDDIAAERQRLAERLARLDADRQKLADQIAELDAAERVLSRIIPGRRSTRRRGRATTAEDGGKAAAAPRRRGRRGRLDQPSEATAPTGRRRGRTGRRGVKRAAKPEVSMGDAAMRAVEALGGAVSAEQIREYLGRELGMQVRPNHLGMALARHRRADRLQEDDGRWSMVQPTGKGT
jgi:hypothetical protein